MTTFRTCDAPSLSVRISRHGHRSAMGALGWSVSRSAVEMAMRARKERLSAPRLLPSNQTHQCMGEKPHDYSAPQTLGRGDSDGLRNLGFSSSA